MSTTRETRVLVTGASGFVGRHVVHASLARGWRVRCSTRRPWVNPPTGVERNDSLEVGPETDWARALDGVEIVFHLANRAHVLKHTVRDRDVEFDRVNAEGTAQLARAARSAGVRRLVYVSSIGVHGASSGHSAFNEESPLRPHNAYARSKVLGEAALRAEAGQGLEFVIVRPPLIYGVGVPANFERLMRLVASGLPLPFASLHNLRSFAAVGNVVDLLLLCGSAVDACGEVFVVADGEDLSTPDLIRTLANGFGKSARLLPFPIVILETAARIARRQHEFEQLRGNLRVDAAKARSQLGWTPRLHVHEELTATARWYAHSRRRQ